MNVKAIEIIQLRSYERTKFSLSKGINLLVGANNSGKSTVIYALKNLQYHSFHKEDIRSLTDYTRTHIEIENISADEALSFYHPKNHKEFKVSEKFTVVWGVSNSDQPEENLYYDSKLEVKRTQHDRTVLVTKDGNKEMNWMQFPRFSDKENQNNFIYPFLSKRKTIGYFTNINKTETFKVSVDLGNLAAKIQKIGNPTHPHCRRFSELCIEILGFEVGVIPTENNTGEPGIYVSETTFIPFRSMGEGVTNITGFLVSLLTENNKLYLIEELENDIHPKALKKLLSLIIEKSDKNQFVISTHSHIVLKHLGSIDKTKIFYIESKRELNNGYLIPTSKVEEINNTPKKRIEILEKLGYDFFDLELYNSYLILEESSAEKIIRDFIIPYFVPDLSTKLKTIAAKGADDLVQKTIDFSRLFVFIHTSPVYYKRAWIISDGDQKGKESINAIQEKFPSWPKSHFINLNKENLELYYPERFKTEVDKVLSMPHGLTKQDAKGKLLKKVCSWASSNPSIAKKEFEKSFKEIISILKSIKKSIS